MLDLDPRVKMDGRSAYSEEVKQRDTLHRAAQQLRGLDIPASDFVREREQIIDRNHALFGTGADGPGRIYRIGPNEDLLGKSPAGPPAARRGLLYAVDYENVDPSSPFIPTFVVGQVNGGGEAGRQIAVAVNGKIVGVGQTFKLAVGDRRAGRGDGAARPFKQGSNDVRVYQVG